MSRISQGNSSTFHQLSAWNVCDQKREDHCCRTGGPTLHMAPKMASSGFRKTAFALTAARVNLVADIAIR